MKTYQNIAFWILVAGGVIWGLNGFGINLADKIFGTWINVIYIIVGLSALITGYAKFKQK